MATAKPEYATKAAQYAIIFGGMAIEHTGYIDSLAKAKTFAKKRYGNTPENRAKLGVKCVYPLGYCDNVVHAVGWS